MCHDYFDPPNCENCLHRDHYSYDWPCIDCRHQVDGPPTNWKLIETLSEKPEETHR